MAIWTPTNKTEKADLIKDLKKMADSIDNEKVQKETGKRLITSEEATKLAELENYDDTKLNKKIEELEEQNARQEVQIEDLEKNQITDTAQGENVTLVDCAEMRLKLYKRKDDQDIFDIGNHKQKTREGYNLSKIKEAYWSLTDKGITNLAKNDGYLLGYPINLKANTTYYLNFVLLSRPTSATTFTNLLDDVQNDSLSFISIEKESHFTIGKVVTKTYTPTKDEVLTTKMWGNANEDIFEFQFWVTSDSTKTTYEQYGAMPSPEFESPIQCVEAYNLADMEVGGYNLTTGAKEYNPNLYRTKDFIKITNSKYLITQENSQTTMAVRVFLYDSEKNFISSSVFGNNIEITDTNAKYFIIQGTLETFNYTLDGIQLIEGTEKKLYAPFGAISFRKQNKNLFIKDNAKNGLYFSGNTVISSSDTSVYNVIMPVKANTKYAFSTINNDLFNNLNSNVVRCAYCNSYPINGLSVIRDKISSADQNRKILTTLEDTKYLLLVFHFATGDLSLLQGIQIEENTVATDYVEHQEQLKTLHLGNIKLYGNETARDGFVYNRKTKEWFVGRKWGVYVVTGNEDWNLATEGFWIRFSQGKLSTKAYCNYYKNYINYSGLVNQKQGFSLLYNNLYIRNTDYTNSNDFKAYLAEQYANGTPIYVVYELLQPVLEPITDEQLIKDLEELYYIKAYEETTHVDSDNLIWFDVVYAKSLPIIIGNLTNALLSSGANV